MTLAQARELERSGHAILISVSRFPGNGKEVIIEHYLTCRECAKLDNCNQSTIAAKPAKP